MSSTESISCLTQVKLDLKKVIENLKLLEEAQTLSNDQQLGDLKQKTEQLLTNLENKPLERYRLLSKKNRKRRQRKKLHSKQHQVVSKPEELPKIDLEVNLGEVKPTNSKIDTNQPLQRSRNYHHHLKSLQECQRFLKTFELLEKLHLVRGQDHAQTQEFSNKLRHLKLVWNCMLQEKQSEQSSNEQQLHQQWNQVFFGLAEKTYFEGKPNLKYFLRKR